MEFPEQIGWAFVNSSGSPIRLAGQSKSLLTGHDNRRMREGSLQGPWWSWSRAEREVGRTFIVHSKRSPT